MPAENRVCIHVTENRTLPLSPYELDSRSGGNWKIPHLRFHHLCGVACSHNVHDCYLASIANLKNGPSGCACVGLNYECSCTYCVCVCCRYGGIPGYLSAAGFTADEQQALKSTFLETFWTHLLNQWQFWNDQWPSAHEGHLHWLQACVYRPSCWLLLCVTRNLIQTCRKRHFGTSGRL